MQTSQNPVPGQSEAQTRESEGRTGRSVVAVVATTPQTVFEDFHRAMVMADAPTVLSVDIPTLLKINISWQHWYPRLLHESLAVGGSNQGNAVDGP